MLNNQLKYPNYNCRIKNENGKKYIFDLVRKKWLILSPEEWVRQHVLNYLINVIGFSASTISIEKEIALNDTKKRFDIVVFDVYLKPLLIVECKAPYVELNQETIAQVLRYNLLVKANLFMITNGISDLVFDQENKKVVLENYFSQKKD